MITERANDQDTNIVTTSVTHAPIHTRLSPRTSRPRLTLVVCRRPNFNVRHLPSRWKQPRHALIDGSAQAQFSHNEFKGRIVHITMAQGLQLRLPRRTRERVQVQHGRPPPRHRNPVVRAVVPVRIRPRLRARQAPREDVAPRRARVHVPLQPEAVPRPVVPRVRAAALQDAQLVGPEVHLARRLELFGVGEPHGLQHSRVHGRRPALGVRRGCRSGLSRVVRGGVEFGEERVPDDAALSQCGDEPVLPVRPARARRGALHLVDA
ncbi:hypothetical protein C8Q77DRAFT_279779 [Trametes polyzona]|nr:hypothetical protein C8Q77DRAFT_279779 [Trametes polyzona]